MSKDSVFKSVGLFLLLIIFVVCLSSISNRLWGGKPETLPKHEDLIINDEMSVWEFGETNGFKNPELKVIFGLKNRSDLQKNLSEYGTPSQIKALVKKNLALTAEASSKNWIKIIVKFCLWFVFLTTIFVILRNREVTPGLRKWLLFLSVLIFGIIMGSDPSPMGTVKDAIHLYGSTGAVFPPRIIALGVFLLIVFIANKYICAWGCQVGALQDLVYRINQSNKRKAIVGRQFKPPFIFTNSVRVATFIFLVLISFLWGVDIIEPVDPFKIYKPAYIGIAGGIFIGIVLIMGLFIYRPWCHLFCPFGLVGWLVEKISRFRISVNYDTCIACQKCASACPSTVMASILRQEKKTVPDCFACYSCRDVCPTSSIEFSTRKRTLPPPGHFEEKKKSKVDKGNN